MVIAQILLFSSLAFLAYQDFKHRAISWIMLLLVFLSVCYVRFFEINAFHFLVDMLINIVVLTIIFFVTYLYFAFKRGIDAKEFINNYLGVGDILFLIAITPFFHPVMFLIFLLASLFLILTGFLFYYIFTKNTDTIPLAGIISVFFIVVTSLNFFVPHFDPIDYAYNYLFYR